MPCSCASFLDHNFYKHGALNTVRPSLSSVPVPREPLRRRLLLLKTITARAHKNAGSSTVRKTNRISVDEEADEGEEDGEPDEFTDVLIDILPGRILRKRR